MGKKFGKPISKADADKLFQSWIHLKHSTNDDVKKTFAHNPQAMRYYGGKKDAFDIAFVFNRDDLAKLLDRIKDEKDGGLVFFNAIRNETGDEGRPTIIAFPFTFDTNAKGKECIKLKLSGNKLDGEDDGEEHPGNGQLDVTTIQNSTIIPASIDLIDIPELF